MIDYLLQGLLFGIVYLAPIGTQNLYVINSAIQKSKIEAYKVAFITIFFDITLAISCFFGIGILIEKYLILKEIVLLLGGVIVTYIGIGLIRYSSEITENKNVDNSLIKIIGSCFAVTWLNPQAVIDGSVLLGGFNASIPSEFSKYFISGVCIASFIWFNSLATFTLMFRVKFNKVVRYINITCGAILIFYGLGLVHSFVKSILS